MLGSTTTPFGQSSNSPCGASSVFGRNSNASSNPFTPKPFGSTNAFGSPTGGSVFGGTSTSVFGVNSSPLGQQKTNGSPSPPAFGTSTAAFSSPSAPAFGTFSSWFDGAQSTTANATGVGQFSFRGLQRGSRLVAYTATAQVNDGDSKQPAAKLQSISAMHINRDKNHEELRWEDCQSGDKGGIGTGGSTIQSNFFDGSPTAVQPLGNSFSSSRTSNPFAPQTSLTRNSLPSSSPFNFPLFSTPPSVSLSNSFAPSPTLVHSSANPFNSSPASNPSAPQTWLTQNSFPFNSSFFNTSTSVSLSNSFAPSPTVVRSSVNPFNSSPASNPSAFQTTFTRNSPPASSPFNSSIFSTPPSVSFLVTTSSSAPSIAAPIPASTCSSASAQGFNSGFSSANTESSPIFQSVARLPQNSSFPSIVPSVSQPSILSASYPFPTSNLAGLIQPTPTKTDETFALTCCRPQSSAASEGLSGFSGTTVVLGQSTFSLRSATQNTAVSQPVPNVSSLRALPAAPQLSIGHFGSAPSIRYGISSMPVLDKPSAPVRLSSLLTSRHLSRSRIRLPARNYETKSDGPKVPFFSNDEGMPTAPKGGAVFVPRDNPRAFVVLPAEQWAQRSNVEKMSPPLCALLHVYKNHTISAEMSAPALVNGSLSPCEDDHLVENNKSNHEHNEHMTDVQASMPRLCRPDYYTEPQITELTVSEMSEPGFCHHVKDFVVGRHGYGSIRFLGETDVRHLDLDSHVKFNNREVIVYMDEREKPPVGEGLNKAAEVMLLNVKCIDKMGNRYIDGPKVDKYREMLLKKAKEQGAEFVSYDPMQGEWKFRVQHFSRYTF